MPHSSDIVIETRGLTKRFAGFTAVQNVDLKVRRGAIHALIGPNGAGKTTFFNLLTKFLQPTAGAILHDGADITAMRPADVARRGMVRSFQISAVFGRMSAHDNVRIALLRPTGVAHEFWKSAAWMGRLDERARALLASVGLADVADVPAAELPYGKKRALEIATTLALEPEVLLLDEPMAGLGHEDIDRVAALIRRVSAGRTVLMVEHNLPVVQALSDVVTVLVRGLVVAHGPYETVARDPAVIEAYMGSGHG